MAMGHGSRVTKNDPFPSLLRLVSVLRL